MGRWNKFELTKAVDSDFPEGLRFAGNYIIFLPCGLFYIGESNNILKRLRTHIQMARYGNQWKTPWGYFTEIKISVRKEKLNFERMMIESRLIDRLKPTLNKVNGRFENWGRYNATN